MRWPWQRRPEQTAPEAATAPPPAGWAFFPPLVTAQRTVPTALRDDFVPRLPTRSAPVQLTSLGHLISDDAPQATIGWEASAATAGDPALLGVDRFSAGDLALAGRARRSAEQRPAPTDATVQRSAIPHPNSTVAETSPTDTVPVPEYSVADDSPHASVGSDVQRADEPAVDADHLDHSRRTSGVAPLVSADGPAPFYTPPDAVAESEPGAHREPSAVDAAAARTTPDPSRAEVRVQRRASTSDVSTSPLPRISAPSASSAPMPHTAAPRVVPRRPLLGLGAPIRPDGATAGEHSVDVQRSASTDREDETSGIAPTVGASSHPSVLLAPTAPHGEPPGVPRGSDVAPVLQRDASTAPAGSSTFEVPAGRLPVVARARADTPVQKQRATADPPTAGSSDRTETLSATEPIVVVPRHRPGDAAQNESAEAGPSSGRPAQLSQIIMPLLLQRRLPAALTATHDALPTPRQPNGVVRQTPTVPARVISGGLHAPASASPSSNAPHAPLQRRTDNAVLRVPRRDVGGTETIVQAGDGTDFTVENTVTVAQRTAASLVPLPYAVAAQSSTWSRASSDLPDTRSGRVLPGSESVHLRVQRMPQQAAADDSVASSDVTRVNLQRAAVSEPEEDWPPVAAGSPVETAASAPAPVSAGAGAGLGSTDVQSPAQMEKLIDRIYAPLVRRLKAEMLSDRERRGVRIDRI